MSVDSNKEYSVNWKNHMIHVRKAFDNLLTSNELTDVTLYCEGQKIGAHKILLSACSAYFRDTFKDVPSPHPVIVLYGVEYGVLTDILHFIYNGEVSVDTAKLDAFLKTAQLLQISGLTDDVNASNEQVLTESESSTNSQQQTRVEEQPEACNTQISTSSAVKENKKVAKRMRSVESEVGPTHTKVGRQDSDSFFISDVKSEPGELANFEDPLEDPLLQADQSNDTKEFFAAGQGGTEEEFKIEYTNYEPRPIMDVEHKVKQSNFSEECLKCTVCDKMFSHPYSLHHHKAVHMGNTRCHICHAVLSRKYNLKMHMRARHNV